MSKYESLARYNLIIKKLRKRPASFQEIEEYLKIESEIQERDFLISKRTFQRDVKDIASLYNIYIVYDFSRKVYHIEYEDQPEANERILEAFDTFHALNIKERLSEYIHYENRKPRGTEHLYGVLHAIKNQLRIAFDYHKYWEEGTSRRTVEPYALKEFKSRWYALGKEVATEEVKIFALDRMAALEILKKKFQLPQDFDIHGHYRYSYGIMHPNADRPETVVLSFDPLQGKYIKSLPLHHTQKILLDTKEELRVQLQLYLTHDFFMELMSHGPALKVLEPRSLVERMRETVQKLQGIYEG